MEVWEIYAAAVSEYQAKNFDAALKLLAEIKKVAPGYRKAYLLESYIWHERCNFVKEFNALAGLMPLLDLANPEQYGLATLALHLFTQVCRQLGANEEIVSLCLLSAERFEELRPGACGELNNAIFAAALVENFSAEDFQKLYATYRKYMSDITPYPKKSYAHEKIRVGFLSADFRLHPVMKWAWVLVRGLDKKFFKTCCYSSVAIPDAVTERIKANADIWRDIFKHDDAAAAKLIRDDEIDILFDLSGHTEGNRLRVAAYHPATVQISGIGFVTSTGLDCFDYFLTDETCAGDESFFTEKLLRLPSSHICFEPSKTFEISQAPCIRNGYVTFGCFNQYCKITDSILSAWKKILDAMPDSRLILKNILQNTDDGKNFVGNRLKDFGIDVSRVELRGFTVEYLHEYGDIDIELDTFPYTGGITTCEALYMGVPVVSLYGDRMGSRVGYSILKNIGLEELAVNSYDEYINRAVALAGDWELLKILRRNLRGMMKKSPLMDSKNYLREIEYAFKKIL